ncbi:restriction endonuclease subunit S [Acidovorax temperans]|uniref:restriction endonuclease subunit S n=1 Tax=Acidovorax temperans TaxID=80878 RepID=UPI0035B3CA97
MLLSNMELLATAPGGVAKLRELILTLAVQGKLVPQDPADEPAGVLLQRLASQRGASFAKISKREQESASVTAPYVLPQSWEWVRLGDVVENMGSGWSPACEEGARTDPQKWAVLRTTAVQLNEYRPHEHKVIPSKLTPRPEIEVKNGDVLITRAGPLNRVGISCWVNDTPPRLMLSDKIVRFHAIGDELLPAFIVLALNAGWTKSQIEVAKTGMAASQVNISQADLKALVLPVCSKTEQSRIVTRVEALMRLCDALEVKGQLEATQHAQLVSTLLGTLTASATPDELADHWQRVAQHFDLLAGRPEAIDALEQTLLQLAVRGLLVPQDPTDEPASALLQRIRAEKDRLIATGQIKRDKPLSAITDEEKPFELPVGWEWVRINDLAEVQGGIQKTQLRTPVKQHFPYLRVANVQRDALRLEEIERFELTMEELERWRLVAGDLLIVEGNGSAEEIGRCAVWTGAIDPCVYQNHLIRVRCFQQECMAFIKLFLNAPSGAEEMKRLAITTSGLYNLSVGKIRNYAVPMAPLAEQSRIVTRVTALRRLCADLRHRLAEREAVQARLAEALVQQQAFA